MAQSTETSTSPAEAQGHALHLGLRLQAANQSDQPVFSNFTVVQGGTGVLFVDFGFLEPAALPSIARLVRSGGNMPESISGRLACRMVLGRDVAAQLAQQLLQQLKGPETTASAKAIKNDA
jgi:hypothetical protein